MEKSSLQLISCHLQNFASYREVSFDFRNQGLTLIQGATGAGKSTLCDAVPWCLFGRTSKDGAVDEVVSWNANSTTCGSITVDINGSHILIVRTRKPNDLYYCTSPDLTPRRGKDLNDTQKLINNLLGIDSSLYLSGAYFHEFSQTAQFFTTTAKNRRAICEQLVDLSLAKNLQLKLAEQKKEISTKIQKHEQSIQSYGEKIQYLARQNDFHEKSKNFEANKAEAIGSLVSLIQSTEAKIKSDEYFAEWSREIIQATKAIGKSICSECGGPKNSQAHSNISHMRHEFELESRDSARLKVNLEGYQRALKKEQASENIYRDLIEKMALESTSIKEAYSKLKLELKEFNIELEDVELLSDIIVDFRGFIIKNTISNLEGHTNQLLEKHFDAEIRVLFDIEEADKLDVTIFKDGNQCVYTQLSKGQRQLLKLCFGVAVMSTISNRHGINFNAIFFDEALSGLDDTMKNKAFGLFKTLGLQYESIFVIDHSIEFKTLFDRQYTVQLINGSSVINAES